MFQAVRFARSLLIQNDFLKSIRTAATYYSVDSGKLSGIIWQAQKKIRAAKEAEDKHCKENQSPPNVEYATRRVDSVKLLDLREPWEAKMDALEAVLCEVK